MANNPFTVTLGKVTTTSIEVITSGGPEVDPWIFDLYAGSSATGTVLATATTGTEDQAYTFTGLTPNTTYTIKAHSNEDSGYDTVLTTTTLVNDPKTATRSQWENLADRVQSKAEIGTVLSTPSDVAYVGTNNIVDGAITSSKMDFSELGIYEKLGEVTLTTNRVPNDTITLKRSDCKYIKLVFTGSVPTAGATLQIRLNGDTGTNYPRVVMQRTVSTSTVEWFIDDSSSIANAASVIVANKPMQISAEISKSPNGWVGWTHTVTSAIVRFGLCQWNSTNNITSVSIGSNTSSIWKAGTNIVVYGHN